jgi:hypothetical protein
VYAPPPNSRPVAEQTVLPTNGPPFRWAVWATPEPPADVLAFYAAETGRPPDANGSHWLEPPVDPRFTAAVYPADRPDRLPPLARADIPADARTLVLLTAKSGPDRPPESDGPPHRDNLFPPDLSPASLRAATIAGRLIWKASDKGPVFVAGGATARGYFTGEGLWLALGRKGREYVLTGTSGGGPAGASVLRQRDGWLRRCELGRLWAAVERSAATRPA